MGTTPIAPAAKAAKDIEYAENASLNFVAVDDRQWHNGREWENQAGGLFPRKTPSPYPLPPTWGERVG